MQILDRGEGWVALNKPAGYHVHPPEKFSRTIPRDKIILYLARDLLGTWVYPVHRLDAGTSGVLLMALNSKSATNLAGQFQRREVRKTYHAIARGWTPPEGQIADPLELESTGTPVDALTYYRNLKTLELDEAVGTRHPKARYSFLQVTPMTGRYHQIRRHLNRIAHPLVGDAVHGDSRHNRFFREKLQIPGLCLKAWSLEFEAPEGRRTLEAPLDEKWTKLEELFGINPA